MYLSEKYPGITENWEKYLKHVQIVLIKNMLPT